MNMLIILIITATTIENMIPLLIGYLKTPPGYVFLGTIHSPGDYFYYVSQFWQLTDLYTSEKISFNVIGWPNFLLGKLIPLFPLYSYHVSVVLLTVVLLIVAYKLSHLLLHSKRAATISLYLFALFHAFPVMREGISSYGDYWNNFAVPRMRFGDVPHQLFIGIASMMLVYCVMTKKKYFIVLWSLILGSLQPVLWGLLAITLLNPFVLLGLPAVLYLQHVFATLPYSQLKAWEATQHTQFTLYHFISATGPIFLISLYPFKQKRFPLIFAALSYLLFLSPVPGILGVSQVRFMSTLAILCLCILATTTLVRVKFWPFILAALTIVLIPNHLITVRLASTFDPHDAYRYLPKAEYNLLVKARTLSKPDDVFFVIYPFNTIFPALSGRKSYNGHPLLTINEPAKNKIPTQGINYLITYSWDPKPSNATSIYASGSLILYKINY